MAKLVSRSTFSRRGRADAVAPNSAVPGKDAGAHESTFQESVLAYNGRHAFRLRRFSLEKPYSVAYFDKSIGPVGRSLDRAFAYACDPSTAAGGLSIARLISSPRFAVKRISSEPGKRGRRLVRLEFLMTPRPAPAGALGQFDERDEIRSGWLLLSPDENWVLREHALIIHAGKAPSVVQIGVVEYQESEHGSQPRNTSTFAPLSATRPTSLPLRSTASGGNYFRKRLSSCQCRDLGRRRPASSAHRFLACRSLTVKTGGRLSDELRSCCLPWH